MAKLGFLCIDVDKRSTVKRIDHICIEGNSENVEKALNNLVGAFPMIVNIEGRKFYVPVSEENEDYSAKEINNALISECRNSAGSAYSIIELVEQFIDREEMKDDDLIYDAREGCYDVDVSDLSDWVIIDIDIPKDYYSDLNYENLNRVLENIEAQCDLYKLEQ